MEAASADVPTLQFATAPAAVVFKSKRPPNVPRAPSPHPASGALSMLLSAAASARGRTDGTSSSTSVKRQRRGDPREHSSLGALGNAPGVCWTMPNARCGGLLTFVCLFLLLKASERAAVTDGSSVASDDAEPSKPSKRKYRKGTNTLRKVRLLPFDDCELAGRV
jgi:hypothetical protein